MNNSEFFDSYSKKFGRDTSNQTFHNQSEAEFTMDSRLVAKQIKENIKRQKNNKLNKDDSSLSDNEKLD